LGGASGLDWTGDSVWVCSRTTDDLEVSKVSATLTTGAVNWKPRPDGSDEVLSFTIIAERFTDGLHAA
jgi:hypothetical protein